MLDSELAAGGQALGVALSQTQRARLLAYLDLLAKWNRHFNLTAVRDSREMLVRHLLDSLALAPQLEGVRLLDIGSGAGLPGIPLAIACPERAFTLLDASLKKTRFLTQARIELGLDNLSVVQARIEDYRPGHPFDCIVARAFAPLGAWCSVAARLLAPGGLLLAMKGAQVQSELAALPAGLRIEAVRALHVPGLSAGRHVVCLRPLGSGAGNPP
jgi:16S rRNA (guanine527-N7)-methyltransferase